VVTNASPLIYLALVKQFSLLNQLFSEVYLPDAVYQATGPKVWSIEELSA
jgi:predicted nucleic acid-binding protein